MADYSGLIDKFKTDDIPKGTDYEELITLAGNAKDEADNSVIDNHDGTITVNEQKYKPVEDNKDGNITVNGTKYKPVEDNEDNTITVNGITFAPVIDNQNGTITVNTQTYEPAHADKVPLKSDIGSITDYTIAGNNLVQKIVSDFKSRSFNVLYYGATSDKSSDSAPAINQAIEDASKVGGTVWVPAGTYLLSNDLIFKSNITFKMDNNATLYAPGQLFRFDTTSTGYNGGVSNVVVDGGTFSGDYDAKNVVNSHANANAFNGCLHHASNIEFKNITFRMTTSNSHTLDLGGCRDINIHDCIFEGFYPQPVREYVEAIQIDYSSKVGLTYHDSIQDANVDGLITINVKIENNTFRPIYGEDGTTIKWYAPNMCGEHVVYSNGEPTNIVIKNNHITDGYVFDDNRGSVGWIHFFGVHNVIIQGNVFESTKQQQSLAIGIICSNADGLTDAVSGNTVSGTYSYQSDVIIKDNTFKGFKTGSVNHGVISVYGNDTHGSTNLQIIDNNFIDNLPDSFDWTTDAPGIDLIQTRGFKDTKVNNNYANDLRRFLFMQENDGTTIQSSYQIENNVIKNVAYVPIVMRTLPASNQTIDINNNQFNMVRECVTVLNTNGYTNFINNDILFHTSSHLSSTNGYSNSAVTIGSYNLNLANNTVIKSSNSAYQYPNAFVLSANPISYSGNYFNGSSISNWKVPKESLLSTQQRFGVQSDAIVCPSGTDIGTFLMGASVPIGLSIIRDNNTATNLIVYKENSNYGYALKPSTKDGSFQIGHWYQGTWTSWANV